MIVGNNLSLLIVGKKQTVDRQRNERYKLYFPAARHCLTVSMIPHYLQPLTSATGQEFLFSTVDLIPIQLHKSLDVLVLFLSRLICLSV